MENGCLLSDELIMGDRECRLERNELASTDTLGGCHLKVLVTTCLIAADRKVIQELLSIKLACWS